jgi:hypothetical protein
VSGQLMLEALLEGKATVKEIADLARHTARRKIPEIIQSLEGNRLDGHYRMLIRLSLEHLVRSIVRRGPLRSFDLAHLMLTRTAFPPGHVSWS